VEIVSLGFLGLHPWELEAYTGIQLHSKLSGFMLLEQKRDTVTYNATRLQMQTTINWAGRSLKKNKWVKLQEVFEIPSMDKMEKKVQDLSNLWGKVKEKEKEKADV
jgi:protein-tyrosine phosphatase